MSSWVISLKRCGIHSTGCAAVSDWPNPLTDSPVHIRRQEVSEAWITTFPTLSNTHNNAMIMNPLCCSLVPRPPHPAFVACSTQQKLGMEASEQGKATVLEVVRSLCVCVCVCRGGGGGGGGGGGERFDLHIMYKAQTIMISTLTHTHMHSEHETIAREITKFLELPSHSTTQDESGGDGNQNQRTKNGKKSRKQKGD